MYGRYFFGLIIFLFLNTLGRDHLFGQCAVINNGYFVTYKMCIRDSRKEDQGLATVKEIEALGVKGGFTKCDVAVEEDVKKLIAEAAAFGGGKIDVIVNAAGVISLQDMMHTTTEEVQRLFNINVVGTVHMIKHGLAHLEANKSGNMILVSSIAGRDGMGMLQTYSASKAAVTSLMQSAAKHEMCIRDSLRSWQRP